jgi:glycosyltransferase involved in cell wall biosynthesis
MLRILNVIDSLYAGGAESLLKNFLIEAKKYEDFQIDVCTLYSRNVFKEELVNNGITVYDLDLPFKYDFRGVLRLVRLINSNNYDIVHVHLFPADIFVALASLFIRNKPKFIFSEHNVYNRRRSIIFYKPVDKFTYSRYQKVVCVSQKIKESLVDYLKELKKKTIVIRNGIPVPDRKSDVEAKKEYDVLCVARLEDAKGIDILLKAVAILKEKVNSPLNVAVVGDGSKSEILFNLSQSLGLENVVHFLGLRKDVSHLMDVSKIFVLPSRWEGLPMVILEAMAHGLPVVSTPVGGIPEIVKSGENGILVPEEDPNSLSEVIFRLLHDSDLLENLSKNAYEFVKQYYSIETYTKNLLGLFRGILEENGK